MYTLATDTLMSRISCVGGENRFRKGAVWRGSCRRGSCRASTRQWLFANHNASVSKVCTTGCSVVSSGSQAGGADQCTGPYSNLPGMDTCNPGAQTTVSSGGGSTATGGGGYAPIIMGSGVVCSPANEGVQDVPNLPDGLYCGLNNTITYCRNGVDQGVRTCPGSCTRTGKLNGKDTCSGACASVIGGTKCASDGGRRLQ